MNTDEIKNTLREEGFVNVYEWTDSAGTQYPQHLHKGKVCFYITQGSIHMMVNGKETTVHEGERFDVPVNTPHTAKVGDDGCKFIVGEEIEGDS